MKNSPLRKSTPAALALLSLSGLAHAHPGHSALDWFTAWPHPGHTSEYASLFLALGFTTVLLGACWLASRRR